MATWNRDPLAPNAYTALPIGAVRARGWLGEQLRLAGDGLTGHMMDIWPDVGPASGWLGGPGENWERGPYYLRGLVALAYTLGDQSLIARARPWIEWTLASQRPDGFFGPAANDDWWARMPMLDALRWYAEATADLRVDPFLGHYFAHQLTHLPQRPLADWGRPRGGDNIDSVLWLYNRTGDESLLELADLLHRQSSDWLSECNAPRPSAEAFEFGHGVNRAMGLKELPVYSQRSHDPAHRAALRRGWERTLAYHGQIQGLFSGDEFLHERGSTQGTELCTIVELLSTFETALAISGELWIADAMERIAYNALPAILSADHRGHQYFQMPNQIECTPGARHFHLHHENDLLFGPATGYGCCAANLHMGWPRFVDHLWLATRDGGLAALLLGPCAVTARVAGGQRVTVVEETDYPFGEEIRFTVRSAEAVDFPLVFRIPAWAGSWSIAVNDAPYANDGSRLATVRRQWRDGDTVTLTLPMPVRTSRWERESIGIERGPLVYALRIGEEWRAVAGTTPFADYEVHPTTPWNYGLLLDPAAPRLEVQHAAMRAQPWAQDGAPIRLVAPGVRIAEWTAVDGCSGPIPTTGLAPNGPVEPLTLIPFGCARLRISMFPLLR